MTQFAQTTRAFYDRACRRVFHQLALQQPVSLDNEWLWYAP
jgi:hypothetical protein